MRICICHRVLPALSNATYGKRVEKGAEIAILAGIGAFVLSLLLRRAIYCLFLFIFSNRGSQLELVAAFEGVGIPLVIEQSSCSSG